MFKRKKNYTAKRNLKPKVNDGKCDNTGNANKTVIHIPKTQGLINILFYFLSITI